MLAIEIINFFSRIWHHSPMPSPTMHKRFRVAIYIALILTALLSGSILSATVPVVENPSVITGQVRDAHSGDPLPWASVYVTEMATGAHTDFEGRFSIHLHPGIYTITISFVGYQEQIEKVVVNKGQQMDKEFRLRPTAKTLTAVSITGMADNHNISEASMSVVRFDSETIKKIPSLMGETDLLKSIQLLPGIQSGGEGFSGFSVRGGSPDQNLMLLDGATVYNASHLMGFFSVFNSDALSDIALYKGDIPAMYGGRLASLVDVKMKEGDMHKTKGNGGIGTIASRLTIEGPVMKERASFLISGRRTYADLFLKLSPDSLLNQNKLWFYDLNGKASLIINPKNRLSISGYSGMDMFSFRNLAEMYWRNQTTSVTWYSMFNEQWTGRFQYVTSRYLFGLKNMIGISSFQWESGMMDHAVRADFTRFVHKNPIRLGFQTIYHNYQPGVVKTLDHELLLEMPTNKSLEHAVYASADLSLSQRLNLQVGIRGSGIMNLGKAAVYHYDDNYQINDTSFHKRGEVYHTDKGLEPRLSVAWLLRDEASVKASYARTRQYVQPASNSASGMPYDIWFPVSPNLKTQVSDQIGLGYFRNFRDNTIEASVEVYAKKMDNQIDFKHNADIFFNEMIEGEIRTGVAEAFGAELLIRKQQGALTGWIGYTLSKVRRKIDEVNENRWYKSNYDKPHNLTLVMNYDAGSRLSFGATFVFTSGAPITLPTGRWEHAGMIMPSYSERNGYRLPNYHRLDLSATVKLNKSISKPGFKNELNFSIYNVYNRKNPFTIFFTPEEKGSSNMKAYALSMFGIVPSVTWNFNF